MDIFTGHEGLHLPYEQALTREKGGKFYNVGAPFIWIGVQIRKFHYITNYYLPRSSPCLSAVAYCFMAGHHTTAVAFMRPWIGY